MANKCLVTTLQGIATASNLKKLNELVFTFVDRPNFSPTDNNFINMNFTTIGAVTITVENGYFVNSTAENLGQTVTTVVGENSFSLRILGSGSKLRFDNKYYISRFGASFNFFNNYNGLAPRYIPSIPATDLKYLDLQKLGIGRCLIITGDVSNINGTDLENIEMFNPFANSDNPYNNFIQVLKGYGSNLIKGANLKTFTSGFYSIEYNLADLNPNIEVIEIWDGVVKGNFENMRLPNVRAVHLGYGLNSKPFDISGRIDYLTYDNVKDHFINLRNCPGATGNIGGFGRRCYLFMSNGVSEFTYTVGTPRLYIMALQNVKITAGLDQYLIDMAALPINPGVDSGLYNMGVEKIISVIGNRTQASDSAVNTLVNKGFTIIINPL